jgi:hypothetical protein
VLSCSAVAVVVVFLLLQRTLALRPTPLLVAASLPLLRSPSLTRPPPLLSLSCTSCLAQSLWLACSLAVSPSSLSWCFVGMSLWCGFVCAYLSYCPLHPPIAASIYWLACVAASRCCVAPLCEQSRETLQFDQLEPPPIVVNRLGARDLFVGLLLVVAGVLGNQRPSDNSVSPSYPFSPLSPSSPFLHPHRVLVDHCPSSSSSLPPLVPFRVSLVVNARGIGLFRY